MKHTVARPSPRAGVTLLELILVMMILAVVMGGGLGLFAALDFGRDQAAGLVKSVVRIAQNSAIARSAPARVRLDVAAGTLRAEGMQVVGTWHFEGMSVQGAFGLDGDLFGAELIEDGYLGSAIAFRGVKGESVEVPVHRDGAFDLTDGFSVSFAVRPAIGGSGWMLRIGRSVGLRINAAGVVEGRFTPVILQENGRPQIGTDVFVRSPEGLVVAEHWTRIKLEYDRQRLVLYLNDVPVASVEEEAVVWPVDEPLRLSDERNPFAGRIDTLVVSAVVAEEPIKLPEGVSFAADTPTWIRFDAGGGLDRNAHPGALRLRLDFDDGTATTILVGVFGTVE